MKLKELLSKIDENQKEIDSHGKLGSKLLDKINYKFRLDWNYYSNRIEGGTLTLEETKSVMANLLKIDNKSKKDFMEMDGHDKEVLDILKISRAEQSISPKRIKEMHKNIIFEFSEKKKKSIGEWKKVNNYVINYKGEKQFFLPFSDVPEAIQNLCNWVNKELEAFHRGKANNHPLEIAAEFHYEYVSIHPFYDGNGRTARLLTNLILISAGFPPIIVKDIHKDAYGQILADIQSYGADKSLFYSFIAERLIESQQLMLDAIAGKEIGEEDDLDKRLKLIDQKFEVLNEQKKPNIFSLKDFDNIYDNWFFSFVLEINKQLSDFTKYFHKSFLYINIKNQSARIPIGSESAQDHLNELSTNYHEREKITVSSTPQLILKIELVRFKKKESISLPQFGFEAGFDGEDYYVRIIGFDKEKSKKTDYVFYHRFNSGELPSIEESKIFIDILKESIIESLEYILSISGNENRKKAEE